MIKGSRLFLTVFISVVIMGFLVVFVYDYDLRPVHLSDIFFFVGVILFFPGLISMTGALEVFVSSQYLFSKYFSRNIKDHHHFKSLAEYKEFKELSSRKKGRKGLEMLTVGLVYIIISMIIGSR